MMLRIKEALDDINLVCKPKDYIVQEGKITVFRNDTKFEVRQVTHFKLRGSNLYMDTVTNYPKWDRNSEYKYKDYESKFCICSLKQVPNVANTSLAVGDKKLFNFEAGVPSEVDGNYECRTVQGSYEVKDQFVMIK